ncbi:MAG TPA: allantoate amidohydrolase [Pseudolysinimonas sp.]|nr:allantoate amidohydrolase [Pseudolysinimonas sp.]
MSDTLTEVRSGARADTVTGLLAEIASIGADRTRGGYSRPVFSSAELELREWFIAHATRRGLDVHTDANGIIQAWWHGSGAGAAGSPGADALASGDPASADPASADPQGAVLTGSHLDSVPGGGAFDGPLGVASSLIAVDHLKRRGIQPVRSLVVAVFPEEEGSRFGVACLGSRLLSGAIDPVRALALKDENGDTFGDLARRNGLDPERFGVDTGFLDSVSSFVELHVEQGRGLIDLDRPVAIGSSILGHGRWRISIHGEGNHAGTTLMEDRRDPIVAAARVIQAVRDIARSHPFARATVGRIVPVPGGTNVIASRVDVWLDVRHPDDLVTAAIVELIRGAAVQLSAEEGCSAELVEESFSATVAFDAPLRDRLARVLPDAPILDTGAGHDAGVLASMLPTAMLFVRNPSGISHSPEEYAEDADAEAGAVALADVLADLIA